MVNEAAGDVKNVSRAELAGKPDLPGRMRGVVERLARQRQLDRIATHGPLLRAGDLKHKDVVRVVVGPEALAARRRQVNVGLERTAELLLEPAAELGERRQPQAIPSYPGGPLTRMPRRGAASPVP